MVEKGQSASLAGLSQPSVGKWFSKVESTEDVKVEGVDSADTLEDGEDVVIKDEEDFTAEEEGFDPGFPSVEDEEKPDLNLIDEEKKPLDGLTSPGSKRILVVVG